MTHYRQTTGKSSRQTGVQTGAPADARVVSVATAVDTREPLTFGEEFFIDFFLENNGNEELFFDLFGVLGGERVGRENNFPDNGIPPGNTGQARVRCEQDVPNRTWGFSTSGPKTITVDLDWRAELWYGGSKNPTVETGFLEEVVLENPIYEPINLSNFNLSESSVTFTTEVTSTADVSNNTDSPTEETVKFQTGEQRTGNPTVTKTIQPGETKTFSATWTPVEQGIDTTGNWQVTAFLQGSDQALTKTIEVTGGGGGGFNAEDFVIQDYAFNEQATVVDTGPEVGVTVQNGNSTSVDVTIEWYVGDTTIASRTFTVSGTSNPSVFASADISNAPSGTNPFGVTITRGGNTIASKETKSLTIERDTTNGDGEDGDDGQDGGDGGQPPDQAPAFASRIVDAARNEPIPAATIVGIGLQIAQRVNEGT